MDEAATLIGMLKATSTYNPIRYPEKSVERRNTVLKQMAKYKYITNDALATYTQQPLNLDLSYVEDDSQGDSYIRRAVARWLAKWCAENKVDLYEDGLKIYTTIDSRLQQFAEEAVAEKMKMLQSRFNNLWGKKNPWRDQDGNEIPDYAFKTAQKIAGL